MENIKPSRTLFYAGRIPPRTCQQGAHIGPLIGTAKYDAFPEPGWAGLGECYACSSTIHYSQIRRAS